MSKRKYPEKQESKSQTKKHFDLTDSQKICDESVQNLINISIDNNVVLDTTQDMNAMEYKMDYKHRGLAIIFNHHKYDNPMGTVTIKDRTGTEKDVEALKETLQLLDFQPDHIIVKNNLTRNEIVRYPNNFTVEQLEILRNSDCIAIFILTHGSKDNKILARDRTYDLYDLINNCTPEFLPELAGKPKLFFINACRGDDHDKGIKLRSICPDTSKTDSTDTINIQNESNVYLHPIHADILISMSSHHQHTSYRNEDGTWYIQEI
jgi:hypothetical protein